MADREYHLRQHKEPYRMTVLFCDWLEQHGFFKNDNLILDLCCGAGANLKYMRDRFKGCSIEGVDNDREIINLGKELNIKLGDVFNLPQSLWDCIVLHQTLSFIDVRDFRDILDPITEQKHVGMIACSSLFYDAPMTFRTRVERDNLPPAFYNTYPLSELKEYFEGKGFKFFSKRFDIDRELPKKESLGTYTVRTSDGLLQLSGVMLMNWYFILAVKTMTMEEMDERMDLLMSLGQGIN